MNEINLHRFSVPIVTGTPQTSPQSTPGTVSTGSVTPFDEILRQKVSQLNGPEFSKHAAARVAQRNIELSESSLNRLTQGMRLAQEKGLDDTLILVDKTAFIVSVKNNTVITTVNGDELNGNVFTNIDGTVII